MLSIDRGKVPQWYTISKTLIIQGFEALAGYAGASPDERRLCVCSVANFELTESAVKLISSFLLSYPLAGLLKRIPDKKPWLKNVFVIW